VREALKDLGVEGKSYVNDLGAVSSVHLNHVYLMGDDLLVEDIHGHLTYVDGGTLFARWEYHGLPRPFDAQPCATSSAVVGVAAGRLYVLSRSAGIEEIAPRMVPVVPSAAPVADDSTLFVPTYKTAATNKTLQSVSLGSGYAGWGWRTNTDIVNDLAISGVAGSSIVYACTTEGAVLAFPASVATTRDVEPLWTTSLHAQIVADPVLAGDDLGLITKDGRLVVLDRLGGSLRWEAYANPGERTSGDPQFGPSHAYYVCGGELRAFDRATGAQAWTLKGAVRFVAERGTRTLLEGEGGTLYSVETKTGKVLSKKSFPGWTFPTRAAKDATFLAISNRGMLVSVESGW
jgi:outer membrane protein assembly factor BamB